MHQVSYIGRTNARPDDIRRQLGGIFELEVKSLETILDATPGQYTLVDIDLNDSSRVLLLKEWLRRKPKDAKVIFVADKASWLQDARACAIGATDVIDRPIDGRTLLAMLWGDVAALAVDPSNPAVQHSPGVDAAVDTLQSIFSSACLGAPIDLATIQSTGDAVVGQIEAQGLAAWIETVRMHHSQTYQHCLLVTGLAVAFGQHIGASRADRQRLSFAGMLHDIGKARIPLTILEKPGPLDANELAVMRKHPQYGLDALDAVSALPAEMRDMVVHHHEYLDGSGYPHGLAAGEISDLVRIITISDVFGALIERRSYKPPLSGTAAYRILLDMGPKLDKDLVREFEFASRLGQRGNV
jgi:putative nucleotidyltransferase with HDIG domain